jgi:hypothetical protein
MGCKNNRSAMVMSENLLLVYLDDLSLQLLNSGKKDAAIFFSERRDIIRRLGLNNLDVKEVLKELTTCRAMAQYGNFSMSEEKLLEQVVIAAINVFNSF